MKKSLHFRIEELVPPEVFDKFGHASWWFLNPQAVQALDFVRERFDKPITVNDWIWDGSYSQSGLRTPNSGSVYKPFSQHTRGNAFDIKVKGMEAPEVYEYILAHESVFVRAGITTIEDIAMTPTWIHFDCRWTDNDKLLIVRP